jgi:sensor histidine kinase YesM
MKSCSQKNVIEVEWNRIMIVPKPGETTNIRNVTNICVSIIWKFMLDVLIQQRRIDIYRNYLFLFTFGLYLWFVTFLILVVSPGFGTIIILFHSTSMTFFSEQDFILRGSVNYKKGCTRLAAASDQVYQFYIINNNNYNYCLLFPNGKWK